MAEEHDNGEGDDGIAPGKDVDRIAKVIARAGICSRRDAEKLIKRRADVSLRVWCLWCVQAIAQIGGERGIFRVGFREFSNPRGVFIRGKGNADMIKAFMPPYAALGEPLAEAAYKQAMGMA